MHVHKYIITYGTVSNRMGFINHVLLTCCTRIFTPIYFEYVGASLPPWAGICAD